MIFEKATVVTLCYAEGPSSEKMEEMAKIDCAIEAELR
jgi:hypothetical protein